MATISQRKKQQKTALVLAKKLEAAADAMGEFSMACLECNEPVRRADDTRITLQQNIREYSGYLMSVFEQGPRAAN